MVAQGGGLARVAGAGATEWAAAGARAAPDAAPRRWAAVVPWAVAATAASPWARVAPGAGAPPTVQGMVIARRRSQKSDGRS